MVVFCVCLVSVQYWWISIRLVTSQFIAVFCSSVHYLSFLCEAFSWTILNSSSFPLFHSGQVFHELIIPLTAVRPQIFFSLTTSFSYPVFLCIFHASPDLVVHFLVFLRSSRFESFIYFRLDNEYRKETMIQDSRFISGVTKMVPCFVLCSCTPSTNYQQQCFRYCGRRK